jgi:phage-Barnase-EndoU-ColicinE5/D-RelE like nuclease2
MPSPRPELLEFSSVRELFLHFQRLFLNGNQSHQISSACGHTVKVFDHHFFHMVKLGHPQKPKPLLMSTEKSLILTTESGFGPYTYDRQRAIYMESAFRCLTTPDEVWEDTTLKSARWIYIKEFDAKPYCHTIFLVGRREEGLVPVTSFPAKRRDARKWCRGVKIHP